jgi:uracil phosphoribosyltransferase
MCVHHSILAEEGLARLDSTETVRVETPCGVYAGLKTPTADTVAVVSIVRAGE